MALSNEQIHNILDNWGLTGTTLERAPTSPLLTECNFPQQRYDMHVFLWKMHLLYGDTAQKAGQMNTANMHYKDAALHASEATLQFLENAVTENTDFMPRKGLYFSCNHCPTHYRYEKYYSLEELENHPAKNSPSGVTVCQRM